MRLLRHNEAVNGSNKPRRTPALSPSKSSKNQDRNEIAPNKRWMIGSRLAPSTTKWSRTARWTAARRLSTKQNLTTDSRYKWP